MLVIAGLVAGLLLYFVNQPAEPKEPSNENSKPENPSNTTMLYFNIPLISEKRNGKWQKRYIELLQNAKGNLKKLITLLAYVVPPRLDQNSSFDFLS